jgi:hypothetical protein
MSQRVESWARQADPARVHETKQAGAYCAATSDAVELPIIDVTHPAFAGLGHARG